MIPITAPNEIPDKESLAAAYLQLCSIEGQRMQYKMSKQYFKKAKDLTFNYVMEPIKRSIYIITYIKTVNITIPRFTTIRKQRFG